MGAAVASRSPATPADGRASATLRIGELARRSGFSIKTLRFYERRGLLPAAARSAGGFRLYTEADLHRLQFIGQARALGLRLDQIRQLVVTARERTCAMTRPLLMKVLAERIRQTAGQIETLTRLKGDLEQRRRLLARRRPSDHGRGYCACFEDGQPAALIQRILPKGAPARPLGRGAPARD